MALKLPRYIIRNMNFYADRENLIGQVSEFQIPELKIKTEKMRNAGMIKERAIDMGFEIGDLQFKMTGYDPQVLALFGVRVGVAHEFMGTGAAVDEDGSVHSAVCFVNGKLVEAKAGAFKAGDKSEHDYTVTVYRLKLEIDGVPLFEIDDFDLKLGGVSQMGDINRALLNG